MKLPDLYIQTFHSCIYSLKLFHTYLGTWGLGIFHFTLWSIPDLLVFLFFMFIFQFKYLPILFQPLLKKQLCIYFCLLFNCLQRKKVSSRCVRRYCFRCAELDRKKGAGLPFFRRLPNGDRSEQFEALLPHDLSPSWHKVAQESVKSVSPLLYLALGLRTKDTKDKARTS